MTSYSNLALDLCRIASETREACTDAVDTFRFGESFRSPCRTCSDRAKELECAADVLDALGGKEQT